MGVPLMIQENDNMRIERLKKDFHLSKKIEVVRAALSLLEKEVEHMKKIRRWKHAAKLVAENSASINKEFQAFSRIKQEAKS